MDVERLGDGRRGQPRARLQGEDGALAPAQRAQRVVAGAARAAALEQLLQHPLPAARRHRGEGETHRAQPVAVGIALPDVGRVLPLRRGEGGRAGRERVIRIDELEQAEPVDRGGVHVPKG